MDLQIVIELFLIGIQYTSIGIGSKSDLCVIFYTFVIHNLNTWALRYGVLRIRESAKQWPGPNRKNPWFCNGNWNSIGILNEFFCFLGTIEPKSEHIFWYKKIISLGVDSLSESGSRNMLIVFLFSMSTISQYDWNISVKCSLKNSAFSESFITKHILSCFPNATIV